MEIKETIKKQHCEIELLQLIIQGIREYSRKIVLID